MPDLTVRVVSDPAVIAVTTVDESVVAVSTSVATIGVTVVGGGGGGGADLSDDNGAALGTAGPGVATEASRADHVHPMPDFADLPDVSVPFATGEAAVYNGTDMEGRPHKRIVMCDFIGAALAYDGVTEPFGPGSANIGLSTTPQGRLVIYSLSEGDVILSAYSPNGHAEETLWIVHEGTAWEELPWGEGDIAQLKAGAMETDWMGTSVAGDWLEGTFMVQTSDQGPVMGMRGTMRQTPSRRSVHIPWTYDSHSPAPENDFGVHEIDASGGAFTAQLPVLDSGRGPIDSVSHEILLYKTDNSGNTVTVEWATADTNSGTVCTLTDQYSWVLLRARSDASAWDVLIQHPAPYDPTDPADYDGTITTKDQALDELAARVRAMEAYNFVVLLDDGEAIPGWVRSDPETVVVRRPPP